MTTTKLVVEIGGSATTPAVVIDGGKVGQLLAFPTPPDNNSVPKSSPTPPLKLIHPSAGMVTVKTLAARYGLTVAAIYSFIKSDPAFPYKNVGIKKKYVVDVGQFENWLARRTAQEKNEHFGIPTTTELLARFKR